MRRHACKSVFHFYTTYRQGLAYLLLKVLIGNWSRNLAKFDYFPSNVLCCTKFIFSNSITGLWRRLLQFFENCSSEWSSLYLPKESSNRLFRCASFSLYSQLLFRLTRLLKDLVTTILLNKFNNNFKNKSQKNGFGKYTSLLGGYHRLSDCHCWDSLKRAYCVRRAL